MAQVGLWDGGAPSSQGVHKEFTVSSQFPGEGREQVFF